ncbi:MAG: transposase, partial [Alphaproteobacteria bacterium]|nr:transposase [Alphaproteobacteria bacterium]
LKTAEVCREHGISPTTFYKWKAKYGDQHHCRHDSGRSSSIDRSTGQVCAARAGVRSHSAKRSLAGLLIAKSARRRGELAMQTAGSGPESPSTVIFAKLQATASGHPGNVGKEQYNQDAG